MSGISITMSCPSCGGSLSMAEGAKVTSCPYCNALLAVEADDGVQTIMLKDKVGRAQAVDAVRRWWRGGYKARDLGRSGVITETYPIYVPFWRLNAMAAGWVCGYKEDHERKSEAIAHLGRIPLEEMIIRDFDWSEMACDTGDLGVEHLYDFEGEAVLHDEGAIPTFDVTTSHTDAIAKGMRQLTSEAAAYTGVPHVTFRDVHVFPKSAGIVYYPIWVVRYSYADRRYFATVDGVTGQVISGRAPGDRLLRSFLMTAGMAISGVGFWLSAWLLLSDVSEGSLIFGAAGMIGSLAIALGTYPLFRYGSEMTAGNVSGGYNIVRGGFGDTDPGK